MASSVIGTFQSQKFREFKRDLNLTVCVIFAMHAAEFTGSIKLAMGFVKPILDQIMFHMKHLQEKLAELSLVVKPDLIIMDARKVFIKGGPAKGELREPNLILASGNQVAIDVEDVKILQSYSGNSLEGKDVWTIKQIKHSVYLGLGLITKWNMKS